jgi:hypothetical protein
MTGIGPTSTPEERWEPRDQPAEIGRKYTKRQMPW